MKYFLRGLLKGISALWITLVLIGLGGLWRLATHPLHITQSSFLTKYLPREFGFQNIYLRTHDYYTLPEIQVTHATYTTPEVTLRTPNMYAGWNLFSLLRGNFNVSVVILEQPEITIRSSDTSQKPFLDIINEALSKIPLKYLAVENGTIIVRDAQEKEWRLERTTLHMLRLLRKTNVSGSSHVLGLSHPIDVMFRGGLDGQTGEYEGTVKVNNLLLDALPVDDPDVKSIFKYYLTPISAEFYVHADPRKTVTSSPHMEWSGHLRFANNSPQRPPLKLSGSWVDQGSLSLRFQKDRLTRDELKTLWPPVAISVKDWLMTHILSLDVSDADLALEWAAGPSGFAFSHIKGKGAFSQGIAQPLATLPSFKNLSGSLEFDKNNARLLIAKGSIETVHFNSSVVDLRGYGTPNPIQLDINLKASGPLTGLGALLRAPALRHKIPYSLDMKKGTFTTQGTLSFPLTKTSKDSLSYDLKGKIVDGQANLTSPSKQKYQFDQIQLTYEVTPISRHIQGQGLVNDLSLQFQHKENHADPQNPVSLTSAKGSGTTKGLLALVPSTVTSQVISPNGGVVDFNGTYQEVKETTKIKGHIDFSASTLAIPLLQWSKAKGQTGTIDIDLRLHKGALESLKQFNIKAKGLVVQGKAQFDPTTNRLYKVILDPFQINGASAKGRGEFKNNIWDISVKAPYIRLEPLLKIGKGSSQHLTGSQAQANPLSKIKPSARPGGYDIHIDVPYVLMDNGFRLQRLKSFIKMRDNRFHALTLDVLDDGKPLTVLYRPVGSEMILDLVLPRIDSFLQGLNITDRIRAEGITIHATKPLNNLDTSIKGKLYVDKIYLKQAPAFAKLLSLVSIEGLIRSLQDQGIVFTDNYAKFEYLDQKVALRRSRIMNGSLGITAMGMVDLKQKTLDIKGVLVPANFFSQLIGKVPIIGRLLTGGKDKGLFSVSYGASGPFSNPKITSNPLGLLAPNIVKNLFEGITRTKPQKPTFRTNDPAKDSEKDDE